MLFLSVFAFAAGYLLNEESSITRICEKRALLPLGWFVLKEKSSLWIFSLAGVTAFLKGYAGTLCLLMNLRTDYEFIFGGIYIFGNIIAAKRAQGLLFTPTLAALGIVFALNEPVFQVTLTALVITYLVTRKIWRCFSIARVFFCFSFLIYASPAEFIFWSAFVLVACIIFNEESPFRAGLIKYSGRILRWRVTL